MDKVELEYLKLLEQCREVRKLNHLSGRHVAESMDSYAQCIYDLERARNIPGMYKFMKYLDSIGLKITLEEV